MKELDMKNLERLLKPLANRRRLAVLHELKYRGDVTVGELAADLKLSIQAMSRHLQKLSHVYYRIGTTRALSTLSHLFNPKAFCTCHY